MHHLFALNCSDIHQKDVYNSSPIPFHLLFIFNQDIVDIKNFMHLKFTNDWVLIDVESTVNIVCIPDATWH